jgi:hypothetical protein
VSAVASAWYADAVAIDLPPGRDTHPAVEQMMLAHWRRASPQQKLDRMFAMGRTVNELARAELRSRYPEATAREIDLRLRSRSLDRATMIAAFGWDPELHGK